MARTRSPRPPDPKIDALRQHGTLNPHPQRVTDPLFRESDFFDARDLLQVKYEMVRRVTVEKQSVRTSAEAFGFSRPSFYQAQAALERGGISALLPAKRGPRHAHKLGAEVVDFLEQELAADPSLGANELVVHVEKRFGFEVHPRSVERALARRKKKRR